MKPFVPGELLHFFQVLDSHLTAPFDIRVIGGAAGALAFGCPTGTLDIDTVNPVDIIRPALNKTITKTGLNIPVSPAGVMEAPWHYESRMTHLPLKKLQRLRVMVPELHDWALMKTVRLSDKDIQDLLAVHKTHRLDMETLITRYQNEIHHILPAGRLLNLLLTMIEELFGEAPAEQALKRIRGKPSL